MLNPTHPGEIIREYLNETGWTITECAKRLGMSRFALSRLLNGRTGISPKLALSLERIGWNTAEFWMHQQAIYNLAKTKRMQTAA